MIDKMVMTNKKRMTHLSIVWIDYKKAYNMVPHTWIRQCLKIFKVADNKRNVFEKSMENWKVGLTSGGQTLGEVKMNSHLLRRQFIINFVC